MQYRLLGRRPRKQKKNKICWTAHKSERGSAHRHDEMKIADIKLLEKKLQRNEIINV